MTAPTGTPEVSVVVVNWNVAGLLDGCLRSISAESQRADVSVEVIVVDNASDQKDYREVVAGYPDVQLIELPENRGYGAACNAGATAAQGDVILFLNPDVELHHGSLSAMHRCFRFAPHIGLVAPLLLNPDGSVQSMGYRFPGPVNILFDLIPVPARLYESPVNGRVPPGNGEHPLAIDYALGAALMVRRSAFEQSGGFDETYFMYSEEVNLQRRFADAGWTRLLAPAARIIHFGGQSTGQQPQAMRRALWTSRARYHQRWSKPRGRQLAGLAARVGFTLNSLRHPENRTSNREIVHTFQTTLADAE